MGSLRRIREERSMPPLLRFVPITPATVILEELAKRKDLGVKTVQAEDEIAGICTAIGASFAGNFAVTTNGSWSFAQERGIGSGRDDRASAGSRGRTARRPSTGLPTKTEQSDLQQALYGRNGGKLGSGHRRLDAERLLPLRIRGRSYRHGAHDAGSASLGRIHRQRFRTVEDPFDEGLPDHQPADHRQNRGRRPFHALRPQREAGTQLGIPRQSRSGAP